MEDSVAEAAKVIDNVIDRCLAGTYRKGDYSAEGVLGNVLMALHVEDRKDPT